MSGETADRKQALRETIRAGRNALTAAQHAASREGITLELRRLARTRGARSLSCYLPHRGEPDTLPFLQWATAQGIDVLLPASQPGDLIDWIRPNGEGTRVGAFGISEPIGESLGPLAAQGVDLMLIPAAAVDLHGHRLGWGRGFFDRNLALMSPRPPVFAIVHEHELLDELPVEPHDAPVSGVVTPGQTLEF